MREVDSHLVRLCVATERRRKMPNYFQTPDNASKRAREFLEVGKKVSALEVLNDFIRSRKHKSKWTLNHEEIMFMFTDLCIDLQRSSYAKDGLYQYRTTCKDTALNSFEKVVKRFLSKAEEKAQTAKKESAEASQAALQAVEDLDYVATPEGLLLSTVSSEGTKERTDRVLLTPWVKFLWESHRNILELLKNNNNLQNVYRDVAKDAFKFCLSYERRTEFRKLCDILRNHLVQAQKYQKQDHSLKFDQPETVQCLVDIRFEQLENSIKMDLWQEAFKAIEEIHNLLGISGKVPKPGLLENFYSKQAKVYLMAGNRLFHAAALHKLFVLRKEQKKTLTSEEAQATASQVLLATLSIPIEPVPSEIDRFLEIDNTSRDKARRLAGLLRIATPPTRASLLHDMVYHNVLQFVPGELLQLHHYLELEFNPLLLCKRVSPILEGLESDEMLKDYIEPLKEITLVRLIKEVSQVYETIELSRLSELAAFANATDLERVVVNTARSNGIQVRIDHNTKSLRFGMDMSFSYKDDTPEGPYVQPMPSEVLCNQLTLMSQALQQAVRIISVKEISAEQQVMAKKTCNDYQTHHRGDHRQVLARKALIEARKEFIENTQKEKEQQEEEERRQREKQEREAEEERLKREAEEREEEKKRKELEEMKLKRAQDRLEALKKTSVGAKALADVTAEDLADMDADEIFSKQLHQMEKEKKERDSKLKAQEKRVDFFERARRIVEMPLLSKQYEEQKEKDKQFHEEYEEERIANAIKERKEAEKTHARLIRMKDDEQRFKKVLQERRKQDLQVKLADFEEDLKKIKADRLEQRRKDRKQKRKIEAAEVKKAEEEKLARLRREEESRMEEMKRKERDAHLEAVRQKQLEREKEVEAKLREREQKELMQEKPKIEGRPSPEREAESWREKERFGARERDREMDREKEREPPRGRYVPPSARAGGGAYRPPGMREERERETDFRDRDRDGERDRHQDQRWPSGRDREGYGRDRDGYGSPRSGPRGREWENSPRGGRRGPRDERDDWKREREVWRGGEQERDRDRERDRDKDRPRRGGYDDDRWRSSRDEQERDGRGRDGGRGWRGDRDRPREDGGWRGGERDGWRAGRSDGWRGRGERDGERERDDRDQEQDREAWRSGRGERGHEPGDWRSGRGDRDQDRDRGGRRDWDRDRDRDQERDHGESWRGGRGERDRDRDQDRDRGRGDRDGLRGPRDRDRERGGQGDWRRGDDQDRPPRDGRARDASPRSSRKFDEEGFELVSRRRN